MRLALCSPLPPQASGIADFSFELLPELARHCTSIDLFTPSGERPLAHLRERFAWFPVAALGQRMSHGSPYDAVLYHIGNNVDFHGEICQLARRVPGIVVLHEYMLQHLHRDLALPHRPEQYLAEMQYCYGQGGLAAGRRLLSVAVGHDLWRYPLFERLVDCSRGVIVHNHSARQRILASRPSARVAVVNLHLGRDVKATGSRPAAALREELGLPASGLLVGAFGFLSDAKRPQEMLSAFSRFRCHHPEALFLLVGDPSSSRTITTLLDGPMAAGVVVTGRVTSDRFLQYMEVVDFAINLRHPTGGETSATLIRLLGTAKAVIVTNTGSFAELPDHCCVKVDVGEHEVDSLLAAMLLLAEDNELRQRLAENGRAHVQAHHSLTDTARGYAEAISQMAGLAPPGEQPPSPAGLPGACTQDLGAALHDLGIGEDEVLLANLAETMLDLGIGS